MNRYYLDPTDGWQVSQTWLALEREAQKFFDQDMLCQENSERGAFAREAILRYLEMEAENAGSVLTRS